MEATSGGGRKLFSTAGKDSSPLGSSLASKSLIDLLPYPYPDVQAQSHEKIDYWDHDPIWTFEVTLHSGEAAQYLPGGLDVAHLRWRIEAAGLAPRLFVPSPERVSWLVRGARGAR